MTPDDEPSGPVFAPRWAVVAAIAAAGFVLAGFAVDVAAGDPVGGLLAGAAAVVALATAGYDALARPSLALDRDGLTVRTGWHPRRYPWSQVTRVEVRTTRRLLVLHALEIDAGDDLIMLSRRRLGTDLDEVSDALAAFRAEAADAGG